MSDSLNLVARSLGVKLDIRYADLFERKEEEKQPTSEEVISNIKQKVRGY